MKRVKKVSKPPISLIKACEGCKRKCTADCQTLRQYIAESVIYVGKR